MKVIDCNAGNEMMECVHAAMLGENVSMCGVCMVQGHFWQSFCQCVRSSTRIEQGSFALQQSLVRSTGPETRARQFDW